MPSCTSIGARKFEIFPSWIRSLFSLSTMLSRRASPPPVGYLWTPLCTHKSLVTWHILMLSVYMCQYRIYSFPLFSHFTQYDYFYISTLGCGPYYTESCNKEREERERETFIK